MGKTEEQFDLPTGGDQSHDFGHSHEHFPFLRDERDWAKIERRRPHHGETLRNAENLSHQFSKTCTEEEGENVVEGEDHAQLTDD